MKISIILLILVTYSFANWNTKCGNSQRTSFVNTIGPESPNDILWEGTIHGRGGSYIHISDNKLIHSRGSDIWLIERPLVCHDLYTGDILWTKEFPGEERSPTFGIGFQDNIIYATNWQGGSGKDTLYALNAENGDIVWKNGIGVFGSPYLGCTFLSNGDFLINLFNWNLARINHTSGEVIWQIELPVFSPAYFNVSVFNNTAYGWEYYENHLTIVAIDVSNGDKKYRISLPNTHPPVNLSDGTYPVISDDGTIFVNRSNNSISAIKDNGKELSIIWSDTTHKSGDVTPAVGPDGSVYYFKNNRIMRANPQNGSIIDSSFSIYPDSLQIGAINFAIDGNGTIFLNTTFYQNKLYSFTKDLQLNWTDTIPYISHGGPALSSTGLLAVAGKDELLRVYKPKNLSNVTKVLKSNDISVSNIHNNLIFSFNLKRSLDLELSIYNLKGQLVYRINPGATSFGFNKVTVKDLPKGQYIASVKLDGEHVTRKVSVIR